MCDLIAEAVRDARQHIVGDARPVCGHEIIGCNCANGDQMIVGTVIAHDADRMHIRQDGEELLELAFQTALLNLITENGIGFLQNTDFLRGNLADDADAETRSRERLPPDQLMRNAELLTDRTDLILEKIGERLNRTGKFDILGHLDHIVMRLDNGGAALSGFIALAALDSVGIDRTLCKISVGTGLTDFIPEDIIEFLADDMTLLLRIVYTLFFQSEKQKE